MKLNEIAGSSVWAITYQNYDDNRIIGIFTSEAAANKAARNLNIPENDYKGANKMTSADVSVKEYKLNKIFTDWSEQSLG